MSKAYCVGFACLICKHIWHTYYIVIVVIISGVILKKLIKRCVEVNKPSLKLKLLGAVKISKYFLAAHSRSIASGGLA